MSISSYFPLFSSSSPPLANIPPHRTHAIYPLMNVSLFFINSTSPLLISSPRHTHSSLPSLFTPFIPLFSLLLSPLSPSLTPLTDFFHHFFVLLIFVSYSFFLRPLPFSHPSSSSLSLPPHHLTLSSLSPSSFHTLWSILHIDLPFPLPLFSTHHPQRDIHHPREENRV